LFAFKRHTKIVIVKSVKCSTITDHDSLFQQLLPQLRCQNISLKIAKGKIAFHHYPEVARGFAQMGTFDVVCCGHNHHYGVEKIGSTLLVNPGQMLGDERQPTFAIIESSSRTVEKVEVGEPMNLSEL